MEIATSSDISKPRLVEFSPLNYLVGGHQPVGTLYAFRSKLDPDRFQDAIRAVLQSCPEIGASIHVGPDGHQFLKTGGSIGFRLEVRDERMPEFWGDGWSPATKLALALDPDVTPESLVERQLPLLGFTLTYFVDGCTLGVRSTLSHLDERALNQLLVSLGQVYQEMDAGARRSTTGDSPSSPDPARSETPPASAERIGGQSDCSVRRIVLPLELFEDYIIQTKAEARGVTSADIVAGLGWKAWALTRPGVSDRIVRLYAELDLRQDKHLDFPKNYRGSATVERVLELPAVEVAHRPVANLALLYRKTIKASLADDLVAELAGFNRDDDADHPRSMQTGVSPGNSSLIINDIRHFGSDGPSFSGESIWRESLRHIQRCDYLEVAKTSGGIVFKYFSTKSQAAAFEWELRKLIATKYVY